MLLEKQEVRVYNYDVTIQLLLFFKVINMYFFVYFIIEKNIICDI